jgi:hypothetical protein
MDEDRSRIIAAFKLFDEFKCYSTCMPRSDLDRVFDASLALVDEDKIRCLIINCLAALHLVQIERAKTEVTADDRKVDLVQRKVFNGAVSMIVNDDLNRDQAVEDTILSAFPHKSKTFEVASRNGMCWLPMHFAIALTADDKISEDGVLVLLSVDPLAMHQLSESGIDEEDLDQYDAFTGCTPAHILCMQKQPRISLVRYFSLRDPKAFLSSD